MRTVKKTKKRTITYYHYLACIVIFLCVLLISITVFISAVWERSDINARDTIMKNVQRQKEHFQIFIEDQYANLEGIANHVGRQEDLMCEDNLTLISDFVEKSASRRITIFYPDGKGMTSSGNNVSITRKKHFTDALNGELGLSDPLESRTSGQSFVALSVPIRAPQSGEVRGVLTASYDMTMLSRLMFEDLYNGEGFAMIVGGEGEMISVASDEIALEKVHSFFDYYRAQDFQNGSFEKMQEDFAAGEADCLKVGNNDDVRYIAYMPMELEDWMICYSVPLSAARTSFAFMTYYTKVLAEVLTVTVIILVLFTWIFNRKKEKVLIDKAEVDALTGVMNRESTVNKIEEWLNAAVYDEFQVLLMLDLDEFKGINDTFGHAAGDEVLRRTAAILKNTFRSSDIVGRIGGDEFVVLMKNVRVESVIQYYMKEVCEKISGMEVPELEGRKVHCSIGASYAPIHGDTFETLYERADAALYEVKRNGRNNFVVYSEVISV